MLDLEHKNKRKAEVGYRKHKKEKKANPNQCEFYLVNKRRRCAMQKKKDRRFCSEHIAFDDSVAASEIKEERVPCPLDPKHSVRAQDLEMHMKKCPSRPVESPYPWYERNRNTQLRRKEEDKREKNGEKSEEKNEGEKNEEKIEGEKKEAEENEGETIEDSAMAKYIDVLRKFSKSLPPMDINIRHHHGLDNWHEEKVNRKHIDQQSSLVGQLQEADLLSHEAFYVEFGCGKGELSRTVNKCILHDYENQTHEQKDNQAVFGYGLIDRGVNRMKMDNKILKDCQVSSAGLVPIVKRSRIDIEHLDLDKFLESAQPTAVVGVSKHLCGVATDLTLKLIFNSSLLESSFLGLVVAMCCRHACDYNQLLPESKAFLALHGIANAHAFKYIKVIVTWAVCGPGNDNIYESGANHPSGLDYAEREQLGHIARRLIDESRAYAINKMLAGTFQAKIYKYAESSTTPENSCLRVQRVKKQER